MNDSLTSSLVFVLYPATLVNTLATLSLSCFCHFGACLHKSKRERVYCPRSGGHPERWCDYTWCAWTIPIYTCCPSIKFNSVPFHFVSVLVWIINYMTILQGGKTTFTNPLDGKWYLPPKGSRACPLGLTTSACSSPSGCDSLEFFRSHRKLLWACTPGQ